MTVLPEGTTTIPNGTTLWSLKPVPPPPYTELQMRGRVLRAVPWPTPDGVEAPALFFVEHDYYDVKPARAVALGAGKNLQPSSSLANCDVHHHCRHGNWFRCDHRGNGAFCRDPTVCRRRAAGQVSSCPTFYHVQRDAHFQNLPRMAE